MYWSLYYKQILTQSFSQIFLCTSYLSYVKCHITPLYLKDNLKKRDWGRNCAEQFTIWYFSIKETRSRALNRVVTVTFDSALSVAPKVNGRPCSPESQAASLRGLCPPLLHHLCSPASHSGQVQRNGLLQMSAPSRSLHEPVLSIPFPSVPYSQKVCIQYPGAMNFKCVS